MEIARNSIEQIRAGLSFPAESGYSLRQQVYDALEHVRFREC